MASAISQLLSGLPATDYYAPRARLSVEGKELPATQIADLLQVTVTLQVDQLAGFTLSINNWDALDLEFKYSDTSTFDVGNRVHIELGYADKVVSTVRGVITSVTPTFPEAGASTIAVSGQDGLILLRDRKPTGSEQKMFKDLTDSQIAERIARRNQLKPKVVDSGTQQPLVFQRDLDDAQFLLERAKRIDFDCYIWNDPASGEDELHFEPPSDGRSRRARVFQFEWGKNLISFSPEITLSRQVSSVTVRGWDPRNKQAIVGHANANDLPGKRGKGKSGPQLADDRLRGKGEVVVDAPVLTQKEADELAKSLLRDRAYRFITGSGKCIGLPDMRPGDNIRISRIGTRYDGDYYVTKVEHSYGAGGYLTSFDVRRVFDGGLE
jgi:phage protein D